MYDVFSFIRVLQCGSCSDLLLRSVEMISDHTGCALVLIKAKLIKLQNVQSLQGHEMCPIYEKNCRYIYKYRWMALKEAKMHTEGNSHPAFLCVWKCSAIAILV